MPTGDAFNIRPRLFVWCSKKFKNAQNLIQLFGTFVIREFVEERGTEDKFCKDATTRPHVHGVCVLFRKHWFLFLLFLALFFFFFFFLYSRFISVICSVERSDIIVSGFVDGIRIDLLHRRYDESFRRDVIRHGARTQRRALSYVAKSSRCCPRGNYELSVAIILLIVD